MKNPTFTKSPRFSMRRQVWSVTTMLLFAACGAAGSKDSSSISASVDQEFGALTEDAELPADEQTNEAVTELEETEAPAEAPAVDEAEALPPEVASNTRALYALRLTWGNFPLNRSLAGQPVDYSGTVAISDGALVKPRGVRLERARQADGIVRPRTSKEVVDLTSTITVAADGVHMLVAASEEDATLSIQLGTQYSETIALSGLAKLVKTAPSATAGQEVRVSLHKIRRAKLPDCMSGTLLGRWVKKTAPNGKELNTAGGFVMNTSGERIGKFFAIAGTNQAGENVAFFKIISRGAFVARGKGSYDPSAKTFTASLHKAGLNVGSFERRVHGVVGCHRRWRHHWFI
jgi:hypothetical protein